jgi:Queuosine salvage protein
VDELRHASAAVAGRARDVKVIAEAIGPYAASLAPLALAPDKHHRRRDREQLAAFWLTLDAINFGSGWFPTLVKRPGRSGYQTIAAGLVDQFDRAGAWSPQQLSRIDPRTIAAVLGQPADHELMVLFAASLNDLGAHVARRGSFTAVVDSVDGSAVALARLLSSWQCFADSSRYDELQLPFRKRAQIAAADLHRAGVVAFGDLDRLTMFADNLVPHVLRLDGVLEFDPRLVARIEHGDLIEHGSEEEVEIRACALHAVELIVAERLDTCAAEIDQLLWLRGQGERYKASPRHRCRCTAY